MANKKKTPTVSQRLKSAAKAGAEKGAQIGNKHGAAAGDFLVRTGEAVVKTRTGKRAVTGAVAGGAVGAALPFVTLIGGAMLGAGALVLWKSFKDKD